MNLDWQEEMFLPNSSEIYDTVNKITAEYQEFIISGQKLEESRFIQLKLR
jgi:hypothetical protein